LTKQLILDAVIRIITREGILGLTMDKVAEETGLAKGTLYRHFKTKTDLVRATIKSCMTPLTDELFEVLDSSLPPDRRLQEMINRHMSYFDRHRDFFRVLFQERSLAQAKLSRYGSKSFWTLLEKAAAVLEEGVRGGLFQPMDALKVSAMLLEASIALISLRLISDTPGPVEDDARALNSVFFHGIEVRQKVKENE
jgi:AcrR family transcriptional regulator